MNLQDWRERDMWLAKNGSLVYWSEREERELVYYTQQDVATASLAEIPEDRSARPWAFQVSLASVNGIEFTPGEFAAESEETRERWMEAFEKFVATKRQ